MMLTKFGKEIRKLRIDENLTLENLSEKTLISVTHLSNIETGNRNVNRIVVNKILSVFNIEADEKEILEQLAYESKINNIKYYSPSEIESIQKLLKSQETEESEK